MSSSPPHAAQAEATPGSTLKSCEPMAQNSARKTDANRRDKPRLRSFMAATILYNNGQSTLDCVIRNISEDGAKLALPAEVALPDRFDLAVPQRNKTYRATMAWR